MKITVSMPARLFAAAEQMARQMGISRSELYARAMEGFIQEQHDADRRALDLVYEKQANRALDPLIGASAIHLLIDDAW